MINTIPILLSDVEQCQNRAGHNLLPCDFVPAELMEELCNETQKPAFGEYCCSTCRSGMYVLLPYPDQALL